MKIKKILVSVLCFLLVLFTAVGCSFTGNDDNGGNNNGGDGNGGNNVTESEYLGDIYSDYFSIGSTVSTYTLKKYAELYKHFNSVTAEYQMKWGRLESTEGVLTYGDADTLLDWAEANGKGVRGHCLLWYKSLPNWVRQKGNSKTACMQIIDKHVQETVEYFGDRVYCWDVVNEALKNSVSDYDLSSGNFYRTGNEVSGSGTMDWYAYCGVDYIRQAFKSAAEARDKLGLNELELYYNDYALNSPNKREACIRLVQALREEDIPIDGIGMQAHYKLPDYQASPETFLSNFEESVKQFTGLGLNVQITELDIRVYADSQAPAEFDALPHDLEVAQAEMYGGIMEICRKYATPWKEGAGAITNVTTWGVADDSSSWDNEYHKEYPQIFDTEHGYKEAYYKIIDF